MAHPDSFFARSATVLRRHFLAIWAAASWPALILAAGCIALAWTIHSSRGDAPFDSVQAWRALSLAGKLGVMIVWVLLISLPSALSTATISAYIWDDSTGLSASLGKAFARLSQIAGRLLALALLVGFCSQLGLFFFAMPGVLVYAVFSFSIPVLVVENASVGTAIRRGMKLGSKRVGTVLGIFLGAAVFFFMAIAFTIALLGARDFSWAERLNILWVSIIVTFSIVMMTTGTMVTQLYRVIREEETQAGTLAARA